MLAPGFPVLGLTTAELMAQLIEVASVPVPQPNALFVAEMAASAADFEK
jgi:hypothetical protein